MKKVFVTVFMAALGITAFAAKGGPENTKALTAFNQFFKGATQIYWDLIEEAELTKASFMYNGEYNEAFFNSDGEMVASGRYISPKQLPADVTHQINQQFAGYAINPKVIEYKVNSDVNYLVILASEKQDLMLKATAAGELMIYKKLKK